MSKRIKLAALPLLLAALLLPQALWAQDGASTTLDTVVVTSTRTEESIREVSANTTVITSEQIRGSSATTMDELLAQQGFQIVNQGAYKLLKIRGMGQNSMSTAMSSNLLVLLNGRQIGSNNVAMMGLANVDHIEIIRGPSAVQYGSSAMGGVVNVITKRGQEGFNASMEAGFGSFGLEKKELAMSGGAGNLDLSIGLSRSSRDDYNVKGDQKWANTSYDYLDNMNLDIGYTIAEKHRIGVNYNYYYQDDVMTSKAWSFAPDVTSADIGSHDSRNTNLAFTYEGGTRDDRFKWLLRYAGGRDSYKGGSLANVAIEDTTLDSRAMTAQIGYDGGVFAISGGFDYLKYDVDGTYEGQASQEDIAGFVSSKLRLFEEKLILSAGGRYDSFATEQQILATSSKSERKTNFAPSVGLAYLPLDWLKFRANYSKGFRLATPKELYGGGFWYIPSPDLKPEKSETFEIGADVNWNYINGSLTYFQSDWQDKIAFVEVPVPAGKYQARNFDAARLAGIEFALDVNVGQALDQAFDLTPYVSLTYMTTRENKDRAAVRAAGKDTFLNVPELTASYGVRFNHPDHGLRAAVNASYYGETFTTDYRNGAPTNPRRYIETEDGTVVDMSLEKTLFDFDEHNTLSGIVEVNNIFDDKNESYLDFPGPGRNFYFGLKYEYN